MAPSDWPVPLYGRCACNALRYRVDRAPMFVHCCHCRACQRETGSAFALNAMVEAEAVTIVAATSPSSSHDAHDAHDDTDTAALAAQPIEPKRIVLPTASGLGQMVVSCPRCCTAVWSCFAGAGPYVAFVKTGTLERDGPAGGGAAAAALDAALRPDINIFCASKMPWTPLDPGVPATDDFYDPPRVWPPHVLARQGALRERTEAWHARGRKWDEVAEGVVDLTGGT